MKLVVVDVQPEYESGTSFDIGDMLRTAAEDYSEILFLFNGEDTLGMISESALKDYYFEKLDYDEEVFDELLAKSEFFDKGYGFFRDVMDSSVCFDRTSIVKIVKYMIDNEIQDIRDLEEEDVNAIGVSELLVDDLEDYGFWVPELEEVLPRWNGSDLAGGARNECMAEVEILGAAQGLSFNHIDDFIYEGENRYSSVMTESLLRGYIRELLIEQSGGPRRMPLDIPIPEDLKAIHRQMKSAGMQLFLVGGAVRDALMNKVPKDYDVATDATPEAVIELLQQDPELRIDLTGKAFGVVRVKTPAGEEYEIATFRKDIGKGRRPDAVEFTTIEDDVKRRDLTINALFYDMDTGEVVDYVGGIDDIKNGVIRAVGDPATRFDEDKLRILRTVRFAGRTGSDLDPATRDAILADNNLNEVSVERITEEFIKGIRSAQDVTHFLSLMRELGLFQQVLPGLEVELTAGKTKDHVVQIAAMLAGNDSSSVKSQLRSMKYSGTDVDTIKFLLDLQLLSRDNAAKLKKEFQRIRVSPERLIEFSKIVGSISPKKAQGFISFAQSPPAANPRDLMTKGLKGPDIGKAMADAESSAYAKLVNELARRKSRKLTR